MTWGAYIDRRVRILRDEIATVRTDAANTGRANAAAITAAAGTPWFMLTTLLTTPTAQTGTTWVRSIQNAYLGGVNANGTTGAVNDTARWRTHLYAGTWTVELFGMVLASGGTVTLDASLDEGTTWVTIGVADLYAAATAGVPNATTAFTFTGIVLPSSGKALVRARVLTRNASNTTGYLTRLSALTWSRTA